MSDTPKPVGEVDASLKGTIRGLHRLRWILISVVGAGLVAGVIALGIIAVHQQQELEASCGFWKGAAVVPINPAPPAHAPSKVGVKLLAGSRVAFYGQECGPAGSLPPNPTLEHWAGYYGIRYQP